MQGSVNLAEIMEQTPRVRVEFDLSRVNIGDLTLLELLDAADASSVPFDELRAAIDDPGKQAHVFYALAWVIMRRQNKSLTFAEVCEYDIVMSGEIDEEGAKASAERAQKIVAVATLAGVSPDEAEKMTVAEVEATVDLAERRNRAARRARKRA
jgi:hypothetical protein